MKALALAALLLISTPVGADEATEQQWQQQRQMQESLSEINTAIDAYMTYLSENWPVARCEEFLRHYELVTSFGMVLVNGEEMPDIPDARILCTITDGDPISAMEKIDPSLGTRALEDELKEQK